MLACNSVKVRVGRLERFAVAAAGQTAGRFTPHTAAPGGLAHMRLIYASHAHTCFQIYQRKQWSGCRKDPGGRRALGCQRQLPLCRCGTQEGRSGLAGNYAFL